MCPQAMSKTKAPKITYKVQTFTDFGNPVRKVLIGKHKTIATAMRQYARIWEIYGRRKLDVAGVKIQPKVWQEMIEEERR